MIDKNVIERAAEQARYEHRRLNPARDMLRSACNILNDLNEEFNADLAVEFFRDGAGKLDYMITTKVR